MVVLKNYFLILSLVLQTSCFIMSGFCNERVSVEEIIEADRRYIEIKNELISLKIEPGRGARIVEFIPTFSNKNWVHPMYIFGMALDNFAGEGFPGQLNTIGYDYKLIKEADEAGAEFWAKTYNDAKGVPKGVEVRKRITLKQGLSTVTLKYTLTNTGDRNARVGFLPKFDVYVSGEKENNYYYRPSIYGIDIAWCEGEKKYGEDFLRNPTQGWSAVINKNTGEGLVFIMDYNYLQWLYNCLNFNTIEWIYDKVSLQPGKKWSTEIKIVPIKGFDQVTFASKNLVACTLVNEKDGYVKVTYRLQAVESDLTNLQINTIITQIDTLKKYIFDNLYIEKISINHPIDITTGNQINEKSGLIVSTIITGKDSNGVLFREEYDYYYRGLQGGGFDIFTGGEKKYFKTPPRKVKKFQDPGGLLFKPELPRRLLEIRGLYGALYNIKEASKIAMIENIDLSYAKLNWDGFSIDFFPYDFSELFRYSIVVINNIDGTGLDDEALFMLKHYVQKGGGLLFLGGYYSFGLGGWNKFKEIEELLPVNIMGPFDLIEIKGNRKIKDEYGKLYKSREFLQIGEVHWIHKVTPKKYTEVQASVDKYPFIVTGRYGKGRVGVVTGTILGLPDKPFWQSSSWPNILGKLLKWLCGDED